MDHSSGYMLKRDANFTGMGSLSTWFRASKLIMEEPGGSGITMIKLKRLWPKQILILSRHLMGRVTWKFLTSFISTPMKTQKSKKKESKITAAFKNAKTQNIQITKIVISHVEP
jgi:hypothetical protein